MTNYTTHPTALLAHEAHHRVGQAIAEYHAADAELVARPLEYVNHRDTANAILHEVQCALFELKSRNALAKETPPAGNEPVATFWMIVALGFVLGVLAGVLR